jgi:hypothetical protein
MYSRALINVFSAIITEVNKDLFWSETGTDLFVIIDFYFRFTPFANFKNLMYKKNIFQLLVAS